MRGFRAAKNVVENAPEFGPFHFWRAISDQVVPQCFSQGRAAAVPGISRPILHDKMDKCWWLSKHAILRIGLRPCSYIGFSCQDSLQTAKNSATLFD